MRWLPNDTEKVDDAEKEYDTDRREHEQDEEETRVGEGIVTRLLLYRNMKFVKGDPPHD